MADLAAHRRYPALALNVPRLASAILVAALLSSPARAQEQAPDTTAPVGADTVRPPLVHLRYTPLALGDFPLLDPGGRLGLRVPPTVLGARWETQLRRELERAREARRRRLAPAAAGGLVQDTLPELPEGPPPGLPPGLAPPADVEPDALDVLAEYADLGLQLRARFEMKLDQLRNERCTPADFNVPASGCQGGFPTPALDQQFNVRAGGIVGDRVHVNVDFDSEREFSANNNINVYYDGLDDEILQRVEVGNVTFDAPASRFITAAIPQNSFGVQARGQLGPIEFHTILAQQKGSELRSRVYTVGERTTQPVDREIRDLDFEPGRFFFVVNPRDFPGFPAVDPLRIDADVLPASVRPSDVRLYRLRAQTGPVNPNLGGINAVAVRRDGPQQVGPFQWELLIEGRDYYLDPSGVWFVLQVRVTDQDFLAASYVTAAGDTVGTFPAVNRGLDTLELIFEPRRGPEVPTFDHEMRNVYRIGGSDIDRETIALTLMVNESERPLDGQGTYLGRLGLARPNDPSTLDRFNRVFPRTFDPDQGAPIRDLFLIFPHLRPFADGTRLQPGELNDSLYRTPTFLLNSQGPPPRFRFQWRYEATGAGDRASLSLGAIQVREGSEKLFVGDQELIRNRHYQIDYTTGTVTFLNPDSLFRGPTQIRAQFEENQLFDEAPKSIIGMATRYNLGRRGRIDFIGLLQRETSLLTRPRLGFEPQANFIGGVSTELRFRPEVLTRVLDALPLIETTTPSGLLLSGEVAVSRPNPNQQGEAYLEEFESAAFRAVELGENAFQLGSRPLSGAGLPANLLGAFGGFDPNDAVPLIWQNLVPGAEQGFRSQDIDSTIVTTGAIETFENVLWMTLKPDTVGGMPDPETGAPRWLRSRTPGPRWRSVTQPFGRSGLGVDLSRTEFLEFWVLEDAELTAREQGAVLVFDFGTVQEDAVAFGPTTFEVIGADTVFSGFRLLGVGQLDTEVDTLTNVFNAARDDVGIHQDLLPSVLNATTGDAVENLPACSLFGPGGVGIPVFPLGNLLARCTRNNGRADTEDLDGDNRLDITVGRVGEDVVRYVFPMGEERFFVREGGSLQDRQGRRLRWRLYRIPFREDTIQIGTPNLRQIRAVRLTVATPARQPEREFFFALARMRLVGAPWVKRAATPIAGLGGSRGEPHGEVVASVVSTENRDLGYTSPPGITNQAERRGQTFELASVQINEKSLRLLARDLRVDERGEAFVRFVDEADKNFLRYRKLRVWARGRGPGWEDGDLEFFLKVGRDEHNFYMYSTPVRSVSWEPEIVIDLERWLLLRARIESRWLRGEQPSGAEECGGDPNAFVACDGPYIVHVRDPGVSPPNLARVSELAVGMRRVGQTVFIDRAEVWVDDIRLSDVVDDMGVAGAVEARLQAADLADVSFAYSARDDRFRQLNQAPSYVTDQAVRIGSTIRLDKLLPEAWGLNVPLGVQHTRSAADPFYLNRSDVRADALTGLRETRSTATTWTLSLRRTRRGEGFWERLLVDPFSFTGQMQHGTATSQLNQAETRNRQFRLDYVNQPGAVTTAGAPAFLVDLVRGLPGFLSNSEFARSLANARLRLNPFLVRTSATLTNNRTRRFAFRVPVRLASDDEIDPLLSVVHTLRTDASVDLRPFNSLALRVDWSSTRDLQDYGDSTTMGRLLQRRREALIGQDIGLERNRTLTTVFSVAPVLSAWFRPRFTLASSFTFTRDPNSTRPVRTVDDSVGAFRVPETFGNSRRRELGATVTPGALARGMLGETHLVTRVLRRIIPLDVTFSRDRRSSFDRAPFSPDFSYQLGLGPFEQFRRQNGFAAATAATTRSRTASSGLQLPLGLSVRGTFRDLEAVTWTRRSGTQEQVQRLQDTREWPSGTVSWTYSPRFIRNVLSSLSASMRYREQVTSTAQPALGGGTEDSRTETETRSLGPSLSLTWAGGVITSVQYNRSETDALTSGNITESEDHDLSANVNFGFRPPRSLVRLPNEIRTTFGYSSEIRRSCLLTLDATECESVSETSRRAIDVRMDTGFSGSVRGGLTFALVQTEQVHTSSEFTQIIFSVFAEVFFVTGQLR